MSPNLLLLLNVVATVTAGKYVFVSEVMYWTEAQTYCRNSYTDLAPISNQYDNDLIGSIGDTGWIGLRRHPGNMTQWMWSGGTEVSKSFWLDGRPSVYATGEFVVFWSHFWYDESYNLHHSFFCYKVHVVQEKLTWEEALHFCREHHSDLASVASETEMMLIERELSKGFYGDSVWIGLRFMAGEWQWVDGQPFEFEFWGAATPPVCPGESFSCGALQGFGQTDGSWRAVEGWTVHNCNLRRHFLCY